MPSRRRLLAALPLAAGLLLLLAAPASAHASLISTDPLGGAELTAAPSSVSVTFNEPVRAGTGDLRVQDADGHRVDRGTVTRLDGGRTVRVEVASLDRGTYVTTWRVVSPDSHPVSGGVAWQVGSGPTPDQAQLDRIVADRAGDTTVRVLDHLARGLLYAAVLALIGGWTFLLLVWPAGVTSRRVRRVLDLAAFGGIVATIGGLGLQGANVAGLGLSAAVRPSLVGEVAGSVYGVAAILRLVAFVAALALTRALVRGRSRAVEAGLAATTIAVVLSVTLAGHARSGRWLVVASLTDLVHVLAAAAWLGGLLLLLVAALPASTPAEARTIAGRFSPLAFGAVVALLVSGLVQSFRQLQPLSSITETEYGQLLLVKLAAFVVLVGLAAYSRTVTRSIWQHEGDPEGNEGRRLLRQGIGAEQAVAVLVLAVTAILAAANPSTASVAEPFSGSRTEGRVVVDAVVTPARTGRNTMHLYVTALDAGLTGEVDTTASAQLAAQGIAPIQIPLTRSDNHHWTSEVAQFPAKGTWELVVRVRVGEFDETVLRFQVPIR
jgi:copper transport protein